MGIKWKEDYSAKTQRLFGLIVGFGAGALITAALLGFMWDWGVVKGAKWWEVMTAFGTVGAVLYAVSAERRRRAERDKLSRSTSHLAVGLMIPQLRVVVDQLRDSFYDSLDRVEQEDGVKHFHEFMSDYEKMNLYFDREILFLLNNSGSSIARRLTFELAQLNQFIVEVRKCFLSEQNEKEWRDEGVKKIKFNKEVLDQGYSAICKIDCLLSEAEGLLNGR